jgi:hypothetical protein
MLTVTLVTYFIRCTESTKLGGFQNAEFGKKNKHKGFQKKHSAAIFFSGCSYCVSEWQKTLENIFYYSFIP